MLQGKYYDSVSPEGAHAYNIRSVKPRVPWDQKARPKVDWILCASGQRCRIPSQNRLLIDSTTVVTVVHVCVLQAQGCLRFRASCSVGRMCSDE